MAGWLRRLKRATSAVEETFEPGFFQIRGEDLLCPVCTRREFVRSSGQVIQKPLFTGWVNPWLKLDTQATVLICVHCFHVLDFARTPERVKPESQEP